MKQSGRGAWRVLGVAFAVVALASCAGRPMPIESVPGDPLGLGVLEVSGSLAPLDAFGFLGDGGGRATEGEVADGSGGFRSRFEVIGGTPEGRTLEVVRRPSSSEGSWVLVRRVEGGGVLEEDTLVLDEQRGVVLRGSVNVDRGVRVVLEPPLATLPAGLEPGKPVTQVMSIRLPLVKSPSKLRERGTATSEITLLGGQRVPVLGREVETVRVREVFTSKLQKATAVRTTDRWFAPGLGLVAERWQEEVVALGIVVERSGRTIRLVAPGSGG